MVEKRSVSQTPYSKYKKGERPTITTSALTKLFACQTALYSPQNFLILHKHIKQNMYTALNYY